MRKRLELFPLKTCEYCGTQFDGNLMSGGENATRKQWEAKRFCDYRCHNASRCGQPHPKPQAKVPVTLRFWDKVTIPDSPFACWVWHGATFPGGYGAFSPEHGVAVRAPRWVWEQTYGPIPEGMFVCHTCDNPRCVNVLHLWLGTAADNNTDMRRKGRAAHQRRAALAAAPGGPEPEASCGAEGG